MNARTVLRTIAACALSLGLAHGAAASTLFGADFSGGSSTLFTLNQATGAATSVGLTGQRIGDLTSNGSTVWGINLDTNRLYTLDTSTGAATLLVGITGTRGNITSIAFDTATNTMYGNTTSAFSGSDLLYSIDLTSGVATQIGSGLGFFNVYALAFAAGNLYGVGDASKELISISTTTGAGTVLGATGRVGLFDLAARPEDGVMFAADTGTFSLYTIDLSSAATTLVGAYGGSPNIAGLAFVSEVPEPSTYMLMLAGLLGLGFVARRRKTL